MLRAWSSILGFLSVFCLDSACANPLHYRSNIRAKLPVNQRLGVTKREDHGLKMQFMKESEK